MSGRIESYKWINSSGGRLRLTETYQVAFSRNDRICGSLLSVYRLFGIRCRFTRYWYRTDTGPRCEYTLLFFSFFALPRFFGKNFIVYRRLALIFALYFKRLQHVWKRANWFLKNDEPSFYSDKNIYLWSSAFLTNSFFIYLFCFIWLFMHKGSITKFNYREHSWKLKYLKVITENKNK